MDSTTINLNPEFENRLTTGHLPDGNTVSHINAKVMVSAGGIYSTANDMLKFLSAVLGLTPTPLSAPIEKTFVIRHRNQPNFGNTAIPWFDRSAYDPPGAEILCHGGTTRGYRAFLGIDKKKRHGIVILTNQTAIEPHFFGLILLQELPLSLHNMTHVVREVVGLGIGLDIEEHTGDWYITTVFPDSAAGKAGIAKGSVIDQINGASVRGKTVQECLSMMAGPAGTAVQLQLIHPETKQISTVKLIKRKYLNYLE
jgi:CubicO group peptidase (beta-lactamase class C family)